MNRIEWLCCQFGSREYYAVPRALKRNDIPIGLLTDLWLPAVRWPGRMIPDGKSRYHPELNAGQVKSFNFSFLPSFLVNKFMKEFNKDLDRIFEKKASAWIDRNLSRICPEIVFAYSYASHDIFKTAKKAGIKTVQGQINPGPGEADIVKKAFYEEFGDSYAPTIPGPAYWERWYRETELADLLVVNSSWSAKLIREAGIPDKKIRIIPLAYEGIRADRFTRDYPGTFSGKRPLKILYLGSISVRKGFHILKKAMNELKGLPVILELAGSLIGPEELLWNLPPNIVYHGRKNAAEKENLFRNADVFILPSLSDGFAITQLEAQAWKLPLIVTVRCGEVVRNGINGIVLDEINVKSITETIRDLLNQPAKLPELSENAVDLEKYSLESIGRQWLGIIQQEC